MQQQLIKKLNDHIRDNHPDLLLKLLEENRLEEYLQENTSAVRHLSFDDASDAMLIALGPSRYNYLHAILEQEFPETFSKFYQKEVLTTELINMVNVCEPVFEEMKFKEEDENNQYLRYAIMGAIHEYLNSELAEIND